MSKGLETCAGTWVRVLRVWVEVRIWTLAEPLPSARVMGYPHSSSTGHLPPAPLM